MTIKSIFTVDPSAERPKAPEERAGRFRSGVQVNGRPMSLEAFRVTVSDWDVARKLHDLLGGKAPQKWQTSGADDIEIYTAASEVTILVERIKTSMVLWGRQAKLRECDGTTQTDGQPCVCPKTLAERKAACKMGTGCEPSTQVYFRLADAPELGTFAFFSPSWDLLREAAAIEERANNADGSFKAKLALSVVTFTTKEGQNRRFVRPSIEEA